MGKALLLFLIINQGFCADRAGEVAKLTKIFDRISTKRVLTVKEKDIFFKKLLDVDLYEFKKDVGENRDELLERASKLNGISPKAISSILNFLII